MGSWDRDSRCSRDKFRDRDRGSRSRLSSRDMDCSWDRDNSRSKCRCSRDKFRDTASGRGRGDSRKRVSLNCTVGSRKIASKGNRPVHIGTLNRVFTQKTRAKTCSRNYSKVWW